MSAVAPDYRAPGYVNNAPTPGVCPVCKSPSDWKDSLDVAQHDATAQRVNHAKLTFAVLGEFAECITDEILDLRGEAFALLQQATEHEQAIRRDLDRQIAVAWAQEHLTQAETRLSTAQGELQAHHERQDKLAHIVADLDDLETRSDAVVKVRDEAQTIDARLDAEARLVAIQRTAENLNNDAQALRVPCDPLALQSRIDEESMNVVSWKRLVDSPADALAEYVENIKRDYEGRPDRLQAAIQLRQFPVSRLAFSGEQS